MSRRANSEPAETEQDANTRQYVRIVPSDGSIDLSSVSAPFRELHALLQPNGRSIRDRLWNYLGFTTPATMECILVTGGAGSPVEYLFGVDDPEVLTGLESLLRRLFPRGYDFDRVDHTGDWLGTDADDSDLFGVEYYGSADQGKDWLTQLTACETFDGNAQSHLPLATITETMAEAAVPMVYQTILRPLSDQRDKAEYYEDLVTPDERPDTATAGASDTSTRSVASPTDQRRREELVDRDHLNLFGVNARVVGVQPERVDGRSVQQLLASLDSAMGAVGNTTYEIDAGHRTGSDADAVYEAIQNRTYHRPNYSRVRSILPLVTNWSRGIAADPSEVPSFCLLSGQSLSTEGSRAVEPTPSERTTLPRPPLDQIDAYHGDGLPIGNPLTADGRTVDEPIVLPPSLQPMHMAWYGKSGSGKSTGMTLAVLENHAATDGLDVLVDSKGDNMPIDYLRAHYERFGTLDDVLYFDCSELLPAFSFFDIRSELDDGVPRATAVEDKIDHYMEILESIMGADRFEDAVRSPAVIRLLLKAMFDPVTGSDSFTHREFHEEARRMQDRQTGPSVSDDDLEQMLEGVLANDARTFRNIMTGVLNRIEEIPVDSRLGRIFNHVPASLDDATDDGTDTVPHFDLADYLDEDAVVIFDTGGLRNESQRVLALAIISNLWTALRRRKRRTEQRTDTDEGSTDAATDAPVSLVDDDGSSTDDTSPLDDFGSLTDDPILMDDGGTQADGDAPLVNLYLEEAADLAVSDLVGELLAQGRSFDCSVTLAMQFPGQLRDDARRAYDEVLNNVSTVVTGNVAHDVGLAERLATDDMSTEEVKNRLSSIRRGRWLVDLPAAYGTPEPRPFLVESLDPPTGHPAAETRPRRAGFDDALARVRDRTATTAGLEVEGSDQATDDPAELQDRRVDSALPHTSRMPSHVSYHTDSESLRCTDCDNRYDPDVDGMRRAIDCCGSLEDVDRSNVPICDLDLKLTPAERQASEWSDHQLMFLQAVYNAEQRRYDPLEYDIANESMLRLRDDVGLDDDAIEPLEDAGLLRHETDYPHRLYTVTPEGRDAIGESYRAGVDFGHGAGDLTESSEHVMLVEIGRRYLESAYVEDPDSPVQTVTPYYQVDGETRLDLAGLDADGEIVVAIEAERPTTDARNEVPVDFDKMAAVDPDEAIWITPGQEDVHAVLDALADPMDGDPRVEKTYSDNTPPHQVHIDAPGLTDITTFLKVRDTRLEEC